MEKNLKSKDFKKILNRLSRAEGQLGGIRRMIESSSSCLDIITQIAAAKAALSMLGVEILKNELICRQKEKKKVDELYLKKLFEINN
jgi:CsoR family transcriptional regulator, copper-sensing transcriptional repressor